ncbi:MULTISPECIES: AAA family ATPase [Chryseobacterium]|uniref:Predicted ATP-binding protein involved in virulence n=1 Tax=Chryseobacterium taihuense TaxID=1141221 RepID=A0A4U8W7A3_9FLAO|nr:MULTISPECIES: AAA family ATPase [Chryseobacterium]QQV01339.1 AAA family ATPase [Chryseobacterium sp. FDAARGOS 1104]VFB02067.1 Predicted ATP-binding protein involved in virulence [Chryseobacterium taihuense]
MNITNFTIEGLHNTKDYELKFFDNKLILVSDNGAGKTTIVNIFYFFLSKQWNKLLEYNFRRIICRINDERIEFTKDFFQNLLQRDSKFKHRFSPNTLIKLNQISDILNSVDFFNMSNKEIEILSEKFEIPSRVIKEYIFEVYEKKENIDNHNNIKSIETKLNSILKDIKIIYLPTYRRIEKDLINILPHLERSIKEYEIQTRRYNSKEENYLELVEFGMNDIQRKIERRCLELKNYFYDKLNTNLIGSYLDDILNKSYNDFDFKKISQIDEEALNYILKRLDDSVISKDGKNKLREFVQSLQFNYSNNNIEDKINAHFVWKLFQIYDFQQKEESDILNLIKICNEYLGNDKELVYNKDEFKVEIILNQETNYKNSIRQLFLDSEILREEKLNRIEFKDLSSGEKQIISLFTHLVLSEKDYYIIIDEPELSLSVPWQEKLLNDILELGKCKGLLAVTHSPFIFQNNLRKYTHALEKFKR